MKIFRDHRQDGNVAVATLKSVGSKSEVQKKEEKNGIKKTLKKPPQPNQSDARLNSLS